jgi:hypothetical protein
MLAPRLNSYAVGSNSPQSSAYANSQNANAKLAGLNKIGGYWKRAHRGGAVTVPVMNTLYQPASSTQSAGASQVALARIGGQNNADAVYDNMAPPATVPKQVGGSDVKWGCYSGGQRRWWTSIKRGVKNMSKKVSAKIGKVTRGMAKKVSTKIGKVTRGMSKKVSAKRG